MVDTDESGALAATAYETRANSVRVPGHLVLPAGVAGAVDERAANGGPARNGGLPVRVTAPSDPYARPVEERA